MQSDLDWMVTQLLSADTNNFLELSRMVGLDPSKDFVGADLSNINLQGEDLQDFDLSSANLSHANLSHTNLSYANLSCSDLTGANLQDSKLTATKFNYADLRGVQWGNSDRSSAVFYGAKSDSPLSGRASNVSAYDNSPNRTSSQSSSLISIEGEILTNE